MKTSFTFLVAAVLSVYSPSVDPGSLLIAQQHSDAGVTTSGDLNGDGFFDIIDLVSLEEAVVLGALAGAGELSACDVDGDGKLTTFDLLVMNDALSNYNEGMDMFDAVKSAIEKDIEKSGDNVAIYLDLARFYRKEKQFYKASNVLRNILEAMDPSHPLYETVQRTLSNLKEEEKNRNMEEEDFLNQEIYRTAEDPTGKVGLRRKVIQMQSRLSNLIKQKDFAAHYNSKRVKARLNSAMEEMLRQVGKDHMVDPDAFQDFNYTVQDIMENPENLTRGLNDEQREKIAKIVNSHTSEMQGEAERIRREISAKQVKVKQSPNAGQEDLTREALLDRRDWRREKNRDNLRIDRHIVANKPEFEPDTISIVAPSYVIKWDVSNVLGARDAALEISKANRAFSNPRGTTVDQANTLYYTPSLNGISGRKKGNAHELEGIGVYQYRVTALNAKGELISRFSDAVELVVVYNNVNEIAGKPQIEPREVSLENPGYTFRWDVSNVEGAKDAAVEISMPNKRFHNGNGRERDRGNTFFFNPSLGKSAGTFSSNIEGLAGPGRYLFRVIAISPYGDFIGRWSDPETLIVSTGADSDLTIKLAAAGNQIAPPKPQIAASDTDFMLTWDVSSIDRASGITLRAMENNGGSEAASQDEPVFTQALDGARGDWHVNPSQLKGSGDYLLSIAALDENGGIISSWSEPSRLVVKSSPERVPDSPEKAKTASPDTPVSIQDPDETPTAAAGQADQPVATQTPPDGKNLEVVSKNTPVYKTRDPSSREIFTLQKGETLVRILTDGLWYRVYYPQQKQYGWVLSFNVRNIDSE